MLRDGMVPTYRWIAEMVTGGRGEVHVPASQAAE
jgi:hypothetical protein